MILGQLSRLLNGKIPLNNGEKHTGLHSAADTVVLGSHWHWEWKSESAPLICSLAHHRLTHATSWGGSSTACVFSWAAGGARWSFINQAAGTWQVKVLWGTEPQCVRGCGGAGRKEQLRGRKARCISSDTQDEQAKVCQHCRPTAPWRIQPLRQEAFRQKECCYSSVMAGIIFRLETGDEFLSTVRLFFIMTEQTLPASHHMQRTFTGIKNIFHNHIKTPM